MDALSSYSYYKRTKLRQKVNGMQDETLYFVTNNEILATKRSFLLPGMGYCFLDHTVAEPRFLKVVFQNRKVSRVLSYNAPNSNEESNILY